MALVPLRALAGLSAPRWLRGRMSRPEGIGSLHVPQPSLAGNPAGAVAAGVSALFAGSATRGMGASVACVIAAVACAALDNDA
eukprot:717305-Pyramimonas_sp.AAC.1